VVPTSRHSRQLANDVIAKDLRASTARAEATTA
jgi:hypothetical protein